MTPAAADRPDGDDLHSRARLAGYDPDLLANAKVLIVGVGALGQNLAQDLALSGVGGLAVVDDDDFEPHNATRSPLYPNRAEQAARGLAKAVNVAHRLAQIMTARVPVVWWRRAMVQEIGDAAMVWADVVCSAVDNPAARAYLAERCRIVGRPLVEAGFEGQALNLGVFEARAGAACYRCINPEVRGAFSCTAYAVNAQVARVVPAIQNAAAVLGALQAEQVVARLHGVAPLAGRRAYLDMRTLAGRVAQLEPDPQCPGVHQRLASVGGSMLVGPVRVDEPAGEVLGRLGRAAPGAALRRPAPV
ncbi:MAG: HesA/MoeB/ThiF family protein, partial [Acidimicrobiales bacterium]